MRLARLLEVIGNNTQVTNAYQDLLAGSDYLRIANINEAERQREISIDCLALLLILIFEFKSQFPSSQARKAFLNCRAENATPEIARQLRFLADLQDESIFELAQSIYDFTVGVMQCTGMDSGEQLLSVLDRNTRRTIGLYFTPQSLARKLVCEVQEWLPEKSDRAGQGESTGKKPYRILDPAAGAGVFLLAWLESIESRPDSNSQDLAHVIENISGIELHPAIATLCHCRIFKWCEKFLPKLVPQQINIHCGDAFRIVGEAKPADSIWESNVILGNPPFNSLSSNTSPWVKRLMAGDFDGINYAEIAGTPIAERKSWLHDDYIKFFRLAHFLVHANQHGLIAFVSNRSFVDNVTFRGMRWQLLNSFDKILINEHSSDEGLFSIATDVTSSIFLKSSGTSLRHDKIEYHKRNKTKTFQPVPPNYLFRPTSRPPKQYLDSISIKDAFHIQGSAAITARDWFITDLDRDRLKQRLHEFCDLRISDEQIRQTYFNRCRSRRYVAGDTRSWQLAPARQWLSTQNWEPAIRQCCYRPFDHRWILWLPEMIDWPRTQLMEVVELPNNLSLVTRRQFPSDQPACYFWMVDSLTIDGIIRSDNRGNERLFPMLRPDEKGNFTSNFTEKALELASANWSQFTACKFGPGPLSTTLFHYIYGLFHTPSFRKTFQEVLSKDYPRIVFSKRESDTLEIVECGRQLIDLHLLRSPGDHLKEPSNELTRVVTTPTFLADAHQIQMGDTSFHDVSVEDWEFRIGTHQVLKKWLVDRKGLPWLESFGLHYQKIRDAVSSTRQLIEQLSKIELS